jgi:hypothetical protein
MPTTRQLQIIEQYRQMMEEAKLRLGTIDAALSGLITIIPMPALREFCFLQLRMLIALACLVSHGDIPATQSKKMRKAYQPDQILPALEELHANFYPVPIQDGPTDPTVDRHFNPVDSGYLTKSDLIRLYGTCGDKLHKGNVRSIFTPAARHPIDHADIREWQGKIGTLLRMDFIALLDPNVKIMCVLAAANDMNRTHVVIAEAMDDSTRTIRPGRRR